MILAALMLHYNHSARLAEALRWVTVADSRFAKSWLKSTVVAALKTSERDQHAILTVFTDRCLYHLVCNSNCDIEAL